MFNGAHFVKELKIASRWVNMLDEHENSNTKENDVVVQTKRKHSTYAKLS